MTHHYSVVTSWTGNTGAGTAGYRGYKRDHEVAAPGKLTPIPCSSDAAFRGDSKRYNPGELFVAALSACHMLWMLHLCADAGIVVVSYVDRASGTMLENPDGSGAFTEVVLRPDIVITARDRIAEVEALNVEANRLCFLANSVKCPVRHQPSVTSV
jgi:organic hydroperoxide reductase OsmC/OhrA